MYLISLNSYGASKISLKETPQPFISIHIAACSEPVNDVIKTIKAAARQDYKNYEIIVLYNNTDDRKLWKPIEAFCEFIPRVKFYNRDNVADYKAGALNICRGLMNPRTEFLFTLDADYLLSPNALTIANNNIHAQGVDLLQFPQAYTNHSKENGLALEFEHYFKLYSAAAGSLNMNLPTGTLTLVNVKCLDSIGGWPTTSITEDAFLGIELLKNNCSIGYSDNIIGRGIMPSSARDLKTQRMRWIFGNFQTIIHTLRTTVLSNRAKSVLITQLSSWLNLNGLAWIYLIIIGLLAPVYRNTTTLTIVFLSLFVIGFHSVFQLIAFKRIWGNWRHAIKSYTIHIANSVEGAYTWWGYVIDRDRPFARTSKFARSVGIDTEQIIFNSLILLSALQIYVQVDKVLGIILFGYALTRAFSRFCLYHSLKNAQVTINKSQTISL
ncbi:hypothetical protein BST97_02130 [Nonlabens spongiae]|uniref:Glycosyltransferase 2-like domain-containing protein n=1 Tax=Nonlabens spongiae TaxID=331648 RepID=A0A1W6MH02_9FLAO|nr:glycosyltransferase family 2 protein [Nonlabens spongiae]ARN76894.1 hypothetical protein BST97_02130 [Nonlabens spongiae]